MSADKLQKVRFTINEILSEPAASPATYFDDEPAPAPASNHPTKVQPPLSPLSSSVRLTRELQRYRRRRQSHCLTISALTLHPAPLGDAPYQRQANARQR